MNPMMIPESTTTGYPKRGLREGWDYLGDNPHGGKNQNVDLGMAEDPEKVLPENGVGTRGGE